MNILVTGATGFIGKNLVKDLIKNNHKVRCLVRKNSNKKDIVFLKKLKVKLFYGDITKKETLANVLDDVDVIYHLAGLLGNFKTPEEYYYKTHILGTKNLLSLCKKQKFICCSSAGVLGHVINADESFSLNPTNIYEKTKAEAEKLVKKYSNYIILRPEFVYGPYDIHVLQLFKSIKEKKFYTLGNGKSLLHPTYINDLTYCFVKCLDKKIKNQIFNIAGEKPISVENMTKLISKELNVKYNKIKIPSILAKIFAFSNEKFAKMLDFNPLLTDTIIDFFTKSRTFNIKKVKNVLNYKPIKLEEGIKRTIGWYKKYHYL